MIYILPLVFAVLKHHGIGLTATDDSDEQLTLAFEFLSFHADICEIPRRQTWTMLLTLPKN